MNETMTSLSIRIREHARALGFDPVGIAPVEGSAHGDFYRRWLEEGRHGEMAYLAREDAVATRLDPRAAWPGVRSAIVVGLSYAQPEGDPGTAPSRGIISRYARGRDYHKVLKKKLLQLLAWLEGEVGHELPIARAYVDTGPVFERELARRAGLGWQGRNTMLIHPRRGSYFFLGTLLLELELEHDAPFTENRCGSCTACVEACPTGALLGRDEAGAPVIDATRCIAYLTIEQRGAIPRELRPLIGNRIFGCDICQEVCPWNGGKFVQLTRERDLLPREGMSGPELIRLMGMTEESWDRFSQGSPVRRAKRAGFLRNVAVALGNWGAAEAVMVLVRALGDEEPLVRGHAAWALGRIGSTEAQEALATRLQIEENAWVRVELERALAG
jgi:epoxyqueuosine reductase